LAASVRKANRLKSLSSGKDVADWLCNEIRCGRFVPGQRLVEADIMREAGAGRGHVREAIQRLEAEGLLVVEEFRGASVRQFNEDDIRQIYRARMALEGMAAHDFAAFGSDRGKAALSALQNDLDACEKKGDIDRFPLLNDKWHAAIMAGAVNPYIQTFVHRLGIPVQRLLFSTFYNAHRIDGANHDHRRITKAIVKNRADEAGALMRLHIQNGLNALLEISRRH
jgi:DNA-binding GntR family transcriptional regulator